LRRRERVLLGHLAGRSAGLYKASLARVSSRRAWGLPAWGSSPVCHTTLQSLRSPPSALQPPPSPPLWEAQTSWTSSMSSARVKAMTKTAARGECSAAAAAGDGGGESAGSCAAADAAGCCAGLLLFLPLGLAWAAPAGACGCCDCVGAVCGSSGSAVAVLQCAQAWHLHQPHWRSALATSHHLVHCAEGESFSRSAAGAFETHCAASASVQRASILARRRAERGRLGG
jgi:hypothetical protein